MAKEFAALDSSGERQVFWAENIYDAEQQVREKGWDVSTLEPTYRVDKVIGATAASVGASAAVASAERGDG